MCSLLQLAYRKYLSEYIDATTYNNSNLSCIIIFGQESIDELFYRLNRQIH